MKPDIETPKYQLWHNEATVMLQAQEASSLDALVTDPPSATGFMGLKWDSNKGGRDAWIEWLESIMREAYRAMKPGAYGLVWALPRTSHWTGMALENAGFEPENVVAHLFGSGFPKNALCQLKPAMEFWWLVQKPLDGTILGNIEKWGCGGLNIDECRIEGTTRQWAEPRGMGYGGGGDAGVVAAVESAKGRWPSNVIHDGSEEVLAEFAKYGERKLGGRNITRKKKTNGYDGGWGDGEGQYPDDTGTAARFFYCAKPSASERRGNTHPTAKSIALMRYLCKLITPRNGLIGDLFSGSFTTGVAALAEGFRFVGSEREAEYFEIGERRMAAAAIKGCQVQNELFDEAA